jgi:hypothetical protein
MATHFRNGKKLEKNWKTFFQISLEFSEKYSKQKNKSINQFKIPHQRQTRNYVSEGTHALRIAIIHLPASGGDQIRVGADTTRLRNRQKRTTSDMTDLQNSQKLGKTLEAARKKHRIVPANQSINQLISSMIKG